MSAKKTFGLKIKKRKKGISLPKVIVDKIRAKNNLSRALHEGFSTKTAQEIQDLQLDLDDRKQDIRNCISDYKIRKRHRLRSKLLRADPSRKRFWRFLKSQIKSAGQISALYKVMTNGVHF